jgi:hypothetical protein
VTNILRVAKALAADRRCSTFLIATIVGLALGARALADDRRFTFVDETRHHPPAGGLEYEQAVTFSTHTREDDKFNRLDFRHELEYGLTDRIQVAVDLAEWHWQQDEEGHETVYDASAAEIKFRIMDPVTDIFGLGFRAEIGVGREMLEWENVLIIDKVIDRWELCYNFVIEPDWEGEKYFHFDEHGGELANRFGVSYELNPSWFVGGELVHEIPLPDWKTGEDQNVFLGPNFSYRGHDWAVTTTALFLVTGGDDESKFKIRAIFEIDF